MRPSLSIPDSEPFCGGTIPLRSSLYLNPNQPEDSHTISLLSSTHVSTTFLAANDLAKGQIAECTKPYPKYGKRKSSSLPTRLVDVLSLSNVGKVGIVRIIDTRSVSTDTQYTALSYFCPARASLQTNSVNIGKLNVRSSY